MVGIAGLGPAIRWLRGEGLDTIRRREAAARRTLLAALRRSLPGALHGCPAAEVVPVVSVTIDGVRAANAATFVEEEQDVLARVGLHCAPSAHETLGNLSEGTLRSTGTAIMKRAAAITGQLNDCICRGREKGVTPAAKRWRTGRVRSARRAAPS